MADKEAEQYEGTLIGRLTREQILKGSADDFARWRADAVAAKERNAVRVRARCDAKRAIETLVAQAWPRGSDGFKVITRALKKAAIATPHDYTRTIDDLEKEAARLRADATRRTEIGTENARKLLAAGVFLSARNKVLGVDYEAREAIDIANEIAAEEAIAAQKANGGFVSFGGDDNCEGCSGWDMTSHRCECGNRRVSWETDGDFESMYVYAQAH